MTPATAPAPLPYASAAMRSALSIAADCLRHRAAALRYEVATRRDLSPAFRREREAYAGSLEQAATLADAQAERHESQAERLARILRA